MAFICFIALIILYFFYISLNANFGVIDDWGVIDTILSNKFISITTHMSPSGGRFFPLNGMDLNVLSYIFGPSVDIFFISNALVMVTISMSFLYIMMAIANKNMKILFFISICAFLLTPAFTSSISRLFVPEKFESFFMILSVLCYLFLFKNRVRFSAFVVFFIGLLSALIALFYKEPGFLMIGTFAFLNILFLLVKNRVSEIKVENRAILFAYNIFLLIFCFVWVVIYYTLVYSKRGEHLYGYSSLSSSYLFFKNSFNYALNEPFLVIGLTCLLIYRIYLVLIKKDRIHLVLDSMIASAFVYICVFFKLLIFDNHYLLPAYIFGLTPIVYFSYLYFKRLKYLVLLCGFIYIANSLPYGIYLLSFYKASAFNMTNSTKFLAHYSQSHKDLDIYLYGVGSYPSTEAIGSIGSWISYYQGENKEKFNMIYPKPYSTPFDDEMLRGKMPSKSGDILLITPFNSHYLTQEKIDDFAKDYILLYKSSLPFNGGLMRFDLKALIKYSLRDFKEGFFQSNNFWGYPLSYYVFVKK